MAIKTIDVTKMVGRVLEQNGFGSDSNDSLDISKAGLWDLLDALSGRDNSKFTKAQAQAELKARKVN